MRHAKIIKVDSLCAMLKALGGLFLRRHAERIRMGLFMRHARNIRGDSLCDVLKALRWTLYASC